MRHFRFQKTPLPYAVLDNRSNKENCVFALAAMLYIHVGDATDVGPSSRTPGRLSV
jgi:hypothetical protein